MKTIRLAAVTLAIGTALLPAPILAAEAVTPQRPSFSSDPNTTAPGTLELESGYFLSDAETADLPLALKWGSGPQTELFLGWSPWLQVADGVDGASDVVVGVRHRFLERESEGFALAYQIAGKIPTADVDDGIGSGVPDLAVALASSWALESATLVGFYQSSLLGRTDRDGALVDHGLALAVGLGLTDELSGFVEWTGTWRPELDSSDTRLLGGLAYTVRPWLVLDAAGGVVLQPGDDVLTGALGFTMNLGQPWGS